MIGLEDGHTELQFEADTPLETSVGKDKAKKPVHKALDNELVLILEEDLPNFPGVLCSMGADSLACPRMAAVPRQI